MRRGLTLIELLIVVLLVAIVMSVAYGTVASTMQAEAKIEELTHGSEIGPAVLEQIRSDLDAAFLPADSPEAFRGTDQKGYSGDRDRIDLVSGVMVYGSDQPYAEPRFHSVNEIGYQVKDSPEHPGEGTLHRRVDPFVDAEPVRGGKLTALVDRVLSFNVEFWDGTRWLTGWLPADHEKKLPAAIKVEVKIRIPDRREPNGVSDRVYATVVPLVR